MTKKKTDNFMVNVSSFVSFKHRDALKSISQKREIPVSRLISFAIDNELQKENAFAFDTTLPESDGDFKYANEAGKFMTFMNKLKSSQGLDILMILRYDIGIPDRDVFLGAFKECLDKNLIEETHREAVGIQADDYKFYQPTGGLTMKRPKKQLSEFDLFLKLQKKYGEEA